MDIYIYIYIYIYIIYIYIYILYILPPPPRGRPHHACRPDQLRRVPSTKLEGTSTTSPCLTGIRERLAEYGWKPHRVFIGPTNICVKNIGVRFHRFRDFKQYYFNSIPPTSPSECLATLKLAVALAPARPEEAVVFVRAPSDTLSCEQAALKASILRASR